MAKYYSSKEIAVFGWKLHEVLFVFLGLLALSTAQFPSFRQRPHHRFRNIRTPLATSASRDRPYVSIPIVLMPDGQGSQTYHYATSPSIGHNKMPNFPLIGETEDSYQVVMSAPPAFTQQYNKPKQHHQKQKSLRMQHYNSKPNHSPLKIVLLNQKTGIHQPQQITLDSDISDIHKQTVSNFLNFATQLGNGVLSQQRKTQQKPNKVTDTQAVLQKVKDSYANSGNGQVIYHQAQALVQQTAQSGYNGQQQVVTQSQQQTVPQYVQSSQAVTVHQHPQVVHTNPSLSYSNQMQLNAQVSALPHSQAPTSIQYSNQGQNVRENHNSQPMVQISSYQVQPQTNYAVQTGHQQYPTNQQSYTSESQRAVTSAPQQTLSVQNIQTHVPQVIAYPQNTQTQPGQTNDQKVYFSYQPAQNIRESVQQANYPVQTIQQTLSQSSSYPSQTYYTVSNGQTIAIPQTSSDTSYTYEHQAKPVTYQTTNYPLKAKQEEDIKSSSKPDGTQLIFASSSSAKQINYSPQGYGDSTSSGGSLLPGSTFVKLSTAKESATQEHQSSEDDEETSEDNSESEETSYKVVYIPLDILKNILTNGVDTKREDKSS